MIPGDRLLCMFITQPETMVFTDWQPHITIVPWFRTDSSSEQLATKLMQKLSSLEQFSVTVGEEARFGYHGRKLVNLIELPSPLQTIDQKFRTLLHELDSWIVDETTKVRREFKPHVTVLKTGRAHQGSTFVCSSLYIVEQKGEYKEIVSRIEL